VAGSVVGLRVTAADIQASINILSATNTFTGNNTFAQPIVGDLTGDVTGKLLTTNFTIEESGGKLLFKHGVTTIASLSSAGVFTALSNVTATGTP
jgi:hypothetical protein